MNVNKRMIVGIIVFLFDIVGWVESGKDTINIIVTRQFPEPNITARTNQEVYFWSIIGGISLIFFFWGMFDKKRR